MGKRKSPESMWIREIFGAGYGSRTRLHGLGSRCITDIRILRLCGYYSRQEWKIQPFFVEEIWTAPGVPGERGNILLRYKFQNLTVSALSFSGQIRYNKWVKIWLPPILGAKPEKNNYIFYDFIEIILNLQALHVTIITYRIPGGKFHNPVVLLH